MDLTLSRPQHIVAAFSPVEGPRQHKEEIAQAIEVLLGEGAHRRGRGVGRGGAVRVVRVVCGHPDGQWRVARKADHGPFGAPADGACDMSDRSASTAPRQDEFLQPREFRVVVRECLVQRKYPFLGEQRKSRDAKFATQIEQIILNAIQQRIDCRWQWFAAQQTQGGVQFVNVTHGGNAGRVFGNPTAVAEPGGSVIARTGGDRTEPKTHGGLLSCPMIDSM